jgi:hypothetical protein
MAATRSAGPVYALVFILGAVIGVGLLGAVRLANQSPEARVHYHANWAIVVDGQRVDLTGNHFMEDVYQCMADPTAQRPEDRVHMHENDHDVVHVHASGVAWGHLLSNLEIGIGDDYLEVGDVRLETDEQRSLKFVLNGAPVRSIRNLQVGDQDRLLVSFGSESFDEVLSSQYAQVASNAGEYNTMPDPASCSGQAEATLGDRIRRAFWF